MSTVDLSAVLKRFEPGWPRRIDCEPGWHSIISAIDIELSMIDPDYTVQQIKEKFGGLRYYFNTKTEHWHVMNEIVAQYEQVAWRTCEISGQPGVLMVKLGWYRTLNPAIAPLGFEVVDREKLLNGEVSS